ncbi:glycoside hydrolase family 88 protein [Martelella radicis]|uniref:Polygalacturonase/rhamnogalacturonyl hydrolase YesR n=1 Tax=Martelella radicis TaxID=1397476 RepID=A0A7W6P858_9HYPH|nr:polygalacturonase/rhamnogalacturonyl hydrolase YesR [Martelella radicis]
MTAIELLAVSARTVTFAVFSGENKYFLKAPVSWRLATESTDETVAEGVSERTVFSINGLEPHTAYRLAIGGEVFDFVTRTESAFADVSAHGASLQSENNAAAIQKTIDDLPEGATLYFGPGVWKSGPLFLKSGLTLMLDPEAVLYGIADRDQYPILAARDEKGRVLGTWEGVAEACYASLLTAINASNIAIVGGGVIDAGGDRGDWWSWHKETRNGARRPRSLFFNRCENVTVTGVTVRNSPAWMVHPVFTRDMLVADVKIESDPESPNTDGFDPECCENVRMRGIHFSVGDDCIAIKAGKRDPKGGLDGPTRNIRIENCFMERGHGGVVIGSEMSGTVSGVTVARCEMRDTDRGLRVKTRRGRGGFVSRILVEDCDMDNVVSPFVMNAFYFCDADGKSDYVQSRDPHPVSEVTPRMSDITFRRIVARNVHTAAAAFYGLPEMPIENVTIEDYTVSYAPDAEAQPPVMACNIDPVRHGGIIAENAAVTASNVVFVREGAEEPWYRQALLRYCDEYAADYRAYKGGALCYEDGCLYRGLIALYEATGEARWFDHLVRHVNAQVNEDGVMNGYVAEDFNIDNILSGRALVWLARHSNDPRYRKAADQLVAQLADHPRVKEGPHWHKHRYPEQVWLDGLYMGLPFKAEYGLAFDRPDLVSEAADELLAGLELTYDADSRLYRHAYDSAKAQPWADKDTGQSPAHWSRAIGWAAMAMVDLIEYLPEGDARDAIIARWAALAERLSALRTADGRWLQVPDRPDLGGNYAESSATAMFAYAYLKASRLDVSDSAAIGRTAFEALYRHAFEVDAEGRRVLGTIVCVAGLGGFNGQYRDGTPGYYLTETINPDDIKGVGPFMMGFAELLARQ